MIPLNCLREGMCHYDVKKKCVTMKNWGIMKRARVFVTLCLACFLTISSISLAETLDAMNNYTSNSSYTVLQKNEVTDEDILLNRALSGVCEVEPISDRGVCPLTNSISGQTVHLEVLTTNQILERELFETGETVDTIAETRVVLLSDTITPQGSGSRYEESYDSSSRCVKLYCTIYYKRASTSNANGACIYKVSGGFSFIDDSVTVTNKSYSCYSNGANLDGVGFVTNQSCSGSVSSTTFSRNTGFSRYIDTTALHNIFCTMSCRITRGGSSWNAEMSNGI